jgi:2'-5' RNA ligase
MPSEPFDHKGVKLRDPEDITTLRQDMLDGAREEMAASFPRSYGGVRLEVQDVDYEGPEKWGYADQDNALMQDKYLARKLRGTLRLIDEKTGQVLDERRQSLMRVPWLTERGTTIHGGNEYVTAMQGRLVPGPYTRRADNGQLETHFNPKPGSGRSFRVMLDPESAQYRLGVKTSQLHLYSLLKDIGVPDDALESQWGAEVFQQNSAKYDRRVLPRAYAQLIPAWRQVAGATPEQMAEAVKDALQQTQVNAAVARRTLPNWFDRTKAAEWRAGALGRIVGQDALEKRAAALDFSPDWAPSELQYLRVQDHIEERAQMALTFSSVMTQKSASATPYYDWDGTLIPRIGGPAGEYLRALKELAALTPTGETLKGGAPVDLLTARPPLFHPAIRQTAARLGLDIGEILHASGPKSEILGPTGRNLVDDDDEVIKEVNDALGERATKVASEFTPDLDDEAMQEAYDAIYGKSKPQLAGMAQWPKEWMPPGTDPLGWVNWYKSYLAGTRTEDDDRQIRRWKQFKARHGAQFQRNPTPRRAFSLRYWAIDPLKLLPEDKRDAFSEEMEDYRAKRTASWMREKTAEFALPDLQQLASFLNQHHSAGVVIEGTQEQIEQQILRFLGGNDSEASAMLSAAEALRSIDTAGPSSAPQEVIKVAGSAPKGCLMAMLPARDVVKLVAWAQENIPESNLVGGGLERDSHVTVLYGYDADVSHKEVAKHLPEKAPAFRLGKIKRFPANEHRPESDVLVIEVESEDLQALNKAMREAFDGRYANSYPTYTPHLTLAYVKPGASKSLDGHARFEGETYVCDELQYSTPEAKRRYTLSIE